MISIKRLRSDLIETGNEQLNEIIESLTGESVESFHTDISTRTGERMIVFTLTDNLEMKLVE